MGIEEIFRADYGRILATLIRLLGDIDLAEEALQEAFAAALEQWPAAGAPANPVAWLVSTGRHKAIDRLRRRAWLAEKQDQIAREIELSAPRLDPQSASRSAHDEETPVPEDRLRLIFTCCHPALATEAQVALTLAHARAASRPRKSRAPSWSPRRPWRSGSCARSPRSARRASRTRFRAPRRSPSGSRP